MKRFTSFLFSVAVFAVLACVPAHAQFVTGKGGDLSHYNAQILSKSPSGGVGYTTGAGAAVTQATNRATGVTINRPTGAITTNNASLAAGASATFTVTNSAVAIGDVVNVSIRSGQTNKETSVRVTAVAAGSFDLTVFNQHASTAETGSIIVNFAVVKAVSS